MELKGIPKIDEAKSVKAICRFIENKIKESKVEGLVVGLSGGLDSSTTAYLCAKSVETSKILGLIMPSETTSEIDIDDAKSVAESLGIEYELIPIDSLIGPFPKMCPHTSSKLAKANLKPRIRMIILYYHSNSLNRLVIGTGNRTELLIGYFTKYGDGGVDILPIGDLYKTHIIQLADYLGVKENIIKKPPTAGLWAGQTDEEDLGVRYKLLDQILHFLVDKKLSEEEVVEYLEIPVDEVLRIEEMVKSSHHKLISPSIVKVR